MWIDTTRAYHARAQWRDDGTWQRINHDLIQDARVAQGSEGSPSAGVIDGQCIKTTASGGIRGYADDKLKQALTKIGDWTVEIIKRSDRAKGFAILPRRWVVERTLADGRLRLRMAEPQPHGSSWPPSNSSLDGSQEHVPK